jgi:hypothetical protein
MPDASYTARHFLLMPTFRRVGACASCSLQNPHCAKLSSLPPSQPLAQIIAIKASTLKGGSNPLSSSHRFGRKSPDTPWVYSWYAETRRHRCKHTCGLLRLSLPFHNLRMVPFAVCTPHLRCWFSLLVPRSVASPAKGMRI